MDSQFKILVLNGILSGQVIELNSENPISFGEKGDYWFVLDSEIALISLKASEKGVFLDPATPYWVNGIPTEYRNEALPLQLPLDLAGLGIVLYPAQTPKENIKPCPLPPRQKHPLAYQDRRTFRPGWLVWGSLLFFAVLLVIGCIAGALFYYAQKPTAVTYDLQAIEQFLSQQQAQEVFQNIAFSLQPNGEIVMTGRCSHSQKLSELVVKLKAQNYTVRSAVICDDQLVENVTYITRLYGFNDLQIHPGKELGTVEISGPVKADAHWGKVVELLRHLPGLKRWSVENFVNAQMDQLVEQLQKMNLENFLNVSQQEDKIFITGILSSQQERQLTSILTQLEQEFGSATFIYQNIEAVTVQESILPAPILTIGGNMSHPFIELSNGTRLQVGSKLPSGYQITSISIEHGIRLKKQEKMVQLPIEI